MLGGAQAQHWHHHVQPRAGDWPLGFPDAWRGHEGHGVLRRGHGPLKCGLCEVQFLPRGGLVSVRHGEPTAAGLYRHPDVAHRTDLVIAVGEHSDTGNTHGL